MHDTKCQIGISLIRNTEEVVYHSLFDSDPLVKSEQVRQEEITLNEEYDIVKLSQPGDTYVIKAKVGDGEFSMLAIDFISFEIIFQNKPDGNKVSPRVIEADHDDEDVYNEKLDKFTEEWNEVT